MRRPPHQLTAPIPANVLAPVFLIALVAIAVPARAQTPLHGSLGIHDPSTIYKEGARYTMFGTGNGIRTKYSFDKFQWTSGPPVFANLPAWAAPLSGNGDFWAPEIAYFNNKFHLYYSVSTFGTQVSAIGLATNTTLDPTNPAYRWVDQGPVIQSTVGSAYNTIDAGILQESNGNLWMVFGSYWNGIYITQLDPATGKRIAANSPTFRIADREPGIEAAQMVERDGKFYLFVNWGTCCDGTNSTYNIRVGRSNSPTGPFVDKNGMAMTGGGGTAFLGAQGRYIGPGHAGIFVENGQEWFGYHFYDGLNNGAPTYDLRPLAWGADGWPVLGAYPAGDYNGDLQTNGADFLVWQRRLGSTNSAADGNDDGRITGADLTVWRTGFATGQGGAAPAPEPAAALLAAIAVGRLTQRRRLGRRLPPGNARSLPPAAAIRL